MTEPVVASTERAPLVSVCIPVYNTERFVAEAVRSALEQSIDDLEVVIVDNASTDATAAVLDRFDDRRIRRFRNATNIGPVPNFNRALSHARGRYVKLLCADDVLYPDCLAEQVEVFENDREGGISLVSCARDIIDARGRRWLRRRFPGRAGRVAGHRAVSLAAQRGANIFGEPAAILMRADDLRRAGEFDPAQSFCVDLDLWCRLLALGDLYVVDRALCCFRISNQSWSFSLSGQQGREYARLVADLQAHQGVRLSLRQRLLARLRTTANAILRQGFTRAVLLRQRWTP